MTTALIFGVSGQDGAYLSELLLAKGYAVFGTSRDAEVARFERLEQRGIRDRVKALSASPVDFRSVVQAILRAEPDEIYNLSGQSSVGLSFEQPVETLESMGLGTVNVLEAMRLLDRKIRFYNACSSECFGATDGQPANETTAFRPRSPYAVAKATAFWIVANYREAYGLFASSGILFNHESPLRPARFVTRKVVQGAAAIAAGRQGKLSLGNLAVRRDWGWAPDYVEAMWRMLQQESADDYVVATGELHTLEEFVAAAFAHFGLDWRRHVEVDPALFRPSDLQSGVGDPRKAAERLGWKAGARMHEVVRRMCEAEAQG
jgi:GDPmannose 4,6-dehydratase